MRTLKIFLLVGFLAVFASSAWAGNIPEFDAVGDDSGNIFAIHDILTFGQVIQKNVGPYGPINFYSDFTYYYYQDPDDREYFSQNAGMLFPDPCFSGGHEYYDGYSHGFIEYLSALTDAYNEGTYTWKIVLQMKPESDINVSIIDCVLKHNEFSLWGDYENLFPEFQAAAEQTGRYRAPWGQLMFVKAGNPSVTVRAFPGRYAHEMFVEPITMDARTLPGLGLVAMDEQLYTSKALWNEELVLVLPETGLTNQSGEAVYNLKQGDQLEVTIKVPQFNTADIRYGKDNVLLKYIGITGTWFYNFDQYASVN